MTDYIQGGSIARAKACTRRSSSTTTSLSADSSRLQSLLHKATPTAAVEARMAPPQRARRRSRHLWRSGRCCRTAPGRSANARGRRSGGTQKSVTDASVRNVRRCAEGRMLLEFGGLGSRPVVVGITGSGRTRGAGAGAGASSKRYCFRNGVQERILWLIRMCSAIICASYRSASACTGSGEWPAEARAHLRGQFATGETLKAGTGDATRHDRRTRAAELAPSHGLVWSEAARGRHGRRGIVHGSIHRRRFPPSEEEDEQKEEGGDQRRTYDRANDCASYRALGETVVDGR